MITFTLVVVILAIITLFSVQNAMPVAISFLFWKFEASLAIVIFLSVLSGVVVTLITVFSRSIRRSVKKDHPASGRDSGDKTF